ncbi:hypothetical protein LOAG_10576 [Loa loa]|uniref:Uncharacterized protein n=1 Tax=Loa loa TaxID=7209 RepID=A0A1S0TPM8_LOALO|nr:hypothetical protein LOAG_10576 [Loa loa]EFO17921.1 hypothetical protein LOAG_10576 [Loa loa]
MNNKVRFDEEMGFLEIWDQIRKRITSDQCEIQEFASMLHNLTYSSELAMKNCKPKNREIYTALCCVLREQIINKKEHFTKTSKYIDDSTAIVDSGFETFHSESPMENSSKLITPNHAKIDQKVKTHRSKCIKPRSQKILLRNVAYDATVVKSAFNDKIINAKQSTNTYPYMVTAIMCCFACLIAFIPHRFFPWFFTLISFNSPPPL